MPQGQKNIQELVEAHIEKGVLGLCVLGLLYAIVHWVVSSPRSVEVFDGVSRTPVPVAPSKAEGVLLEAAKKIEGRANDATVPDLQPAGHTGRLKMFQNTPFVTDMGTFAGFMRPLPLREGPEVPTAEYPTLVGLQMRVPEVTPAPVVWAGWTWHQENGKVSESVMATVVARYPFAELHGRWDQPLENSNVQTRVVVADVEVQAEMHLSDGSWQRVDPELVAARPEGWASAPQPPAYDGTNASEATAWIEGLQKGYQRELTKPDFYQVYAPGTGAWQAWPARLPQNMVTNADDELWFHVTGLQTGQEYRYRYRVKFANPLFGATGDLAEEDRADAAEPFILSGWSDWSSPVWVKDMKRFHITGTNRNEDQLKVAVTAQKYGQEATAEFRVSPGDLIGEPRRMIVTDPLTRQDAETDVDFNTGCVVVDIRFAKESYQSGTAKESAELIYMTPDGQLHSRLHWVDDLERRAEKGD